MIQPANFGRAIVVSRPDAKVFDLARFDYASSVYGNSGDFTATGTFANGTTQSVSRSFNGSKNPTTLTVGWTGLTAVSINYVGGTFSTFGSLDNFVFATSGTTPPTPPPTPPAATGFVAEAEASTNSVAGSVSQWQGVAGGVGSSIQALPDVGQNLKTFADYSVNGPRRDYAVTLPAAGRYYLWARGRGTVGDVGGSNSLHFGLAGGRVETAEAVTFDTDQLAWSNARYNAGRAYIDVAKAGTYTVNLYLREDGVVLDRFLLTSNAAFVPAGDGPAAGPLA